MGRLPGLANVKGLGEVVESIADFYTGLQQLKANRARLTTPRDEAYARLQTRGKEDIGKYYGTETTGGFEHAKEQLPLFRVNSKLNEPRLAKLALEANVAGRHFSTKSTREYEQSLKQAEKEEKQSIAPIDRSVIVLPSRGPFTINDKENWEVLEIILKDQAKPYFELNGPITVYPVDKDIVDAQDGTLLTQLFFGDLDGWSDFGGCDRCLDGDDRVRGVRRVSAEGTSKIFSRQPYTQKQIERYSQLVQGVRNGTLPASKLEKVLEFLLGLKQ